MKIVSVWIVYFICELHAETIISPQKPKFEQSPKDSFPLRFKELLLKCQATGIPIPLITWYKDGEVLQTQRDRPGTSNRITNHGELFFLSFSIEDEGQYYCNASNVHGWTLSSKASVRAAYFNSERAEGPENQLADVGDRVVFQCVPPIGLPKPTLSWTHNSNTVEQNNRVKILEAGSLVIESVSQRDHGTYQCRAQNIAGEWKSKNAVLTVQRKPRFNFSPGSKQVFVGSSVELECSISNDQNETVLWRRQGGEIPRTSLLNRRNLRVENVQLLDAGNYICEVNTVSGLVEAIFRLYVLSPPSFLITPDDREVFAGDSVFLDCLTTGRPLPVVRWIHNGENLWIPVKNDYEIGRYRLFPNGTLLINEISVEDEGLYECKASQLTSIVKSSAYLSVRSPNLVPLPLIEVGPQNATFHVGSTATLPCHATVLRYPLHNYRFSSLSRPELTIYWLINGVRASPHSDSRIEISGYLRISGVRMSDAGVYTCRAEVDDFLNPVRSTTWSASIKVVDEIGPHSSAFPETQGFIPDPPEQVNIVEIGYTWFILEIASKNSTDDVRSHTFRTHSAPHTPSGFRVEVAVHNASSGWQVAVPYTTDTRISVHNLSSQTGYYVLVRAANQHGIGKPLLLEHMVRTLAPVVISDDDPLSLTSKIQPVQFSQLKLRSISPSEVLVEWSICGPASSIAHLSGFKATARAVPLSYCVNFDSENIVMALDEPKHATNCHLTQSSYLLGDFEEIPHCSVSELGRRSVLGRSPPNFLSQVHTKLIPTADWRSMSSMLLVIEALRPFVCYAIELEAFASFTTFDHYVSKKSHTSTVLTYDSTPIGAPKVLNARWLKNGTVLDIAWQPPSEWKQSGVLTGYKMRVLSSASKFNQILNFGPEKRSAQLRDLDPWTNYTIYLAAVNCRGEGVRSLPVHVFTSPFEHTNFLYNHNVPKTGASFLPTAMSWETRQPNYRRIVFDGRETLLETNSAHRLDDPDMDVVVSETDSSSGLAREPWFIISVVGFVVLWILIVLVLVLCGRHRNRRQRRRAESSDIGSVTKNGRLISPTDPYSLSYSAASSWPSNLPTEIHPLVSSYDPNYYSEKIASPVVGSGYPALPTGINGLSHGTVAFGNSVAVNGCSPPVAVTASPLPNYTYGAQYSFGPPSMGYVTSNSISVDAGVKCFQPLGSDANHCPDVRAKSALRPIPVTQQLSSRFDRSTPNKSSRSDANTLQEEEDTVTPYASVPVMQQLVLLDRATASSKHTAMNDHPGVVRHLSLAEIIPPPPDYPPPSIPSGSSPPPLPTSSSDRPAVWLHTGMTAGGSGSGDDSAYYAHSELQPALSHQLNTSQPRIPPHQWSCSLTASDASSTLLPHELAQHSDQKAGTQPFVFANITDPHAISFGLGSVQFSSAKFVSWADVGFSAVDKHTCVGGMYERLFARRFVRLAS
ncbi:roundabout, axon guidance receptor 1 [Paragonimus westermani]|uniref:Roundabout, axon guidance receptor 1 n=1 Tax=Paragonimus westermani TaxID=34504 RepID=A0A5J4NLB4_9TREM|nr:roundabout, axon guidance receptor 1 [Paragonimus westermani]